MNRSLVHVGVWLSVVFAAAFIMLSPIASLAQADTSKCIPGRPIVESGEMVADPIMNNEDPVFWIKGLDVLPSEQDSGRSHISKVQVSVVSATIKDLAHGNSYTVRVEEQPTFIPVWHYVFVLRLVGPLPLQRGQIQGRVEVRVAAWSESECESKQSRSRVLTKTISISN